MISSLLQRMFERMAGAVPLRLHVTFADGSSYQNRPGAPDVRLHYRSRGAELRTLTQGHVGMLESYFEGSLDVDGDFAHAFDIGLATDFSSHPGPVVWLRNQWHELRHSNRDRARAKRNARFHYGIGTDFYRLWLDEPFMMYTCAYWPDGTRTVEEAQENKIDHVCRKIRLKPGERVVDIGCGFGGFMFRAAERYGVSVCGTNTTSEQVRWLDAEIARRGLGDRLSVKEADFREVHDQFDKVVSIGVLEHAGRDQIAEVVKAHADFLQPGGIGMLHFIGHVGRRDTEFYIRKYVFPGGWIPSLSETLDAMEANGLEILDVENLRRHYALTLDAWAERFERRWPEIQALDPQRFDTRFRRIWRTYLVSCAAMFRSPLSTTHLFQITFAKGNVDTQSYPMSRRAYYEDGR